MGIGNKKNKNIMLLIVLLLIVLVCFSLWYLRNFYSVNFVHIVRVEAKNGVCDLSGIDFSTSLVQLQSELEYIPGLLTPDEFAVREDEAVTGSYWELPAATSRVILKMPDNATYLATGNSVDYAHRAYFNGELRHQAGVPAETARDFIPGCSQMIVETSPEDGVIELVQQGANFVHRTGGGHGGIYLGRPSVMHRFLALNFGMEYINVGLFAALFIVHLTLFVVWQGYRSNLIFSLLCLTWVVRTGITGIKVFYALFPSLPWHIAFRAEYLSLPVAMILLIHLVREMFPGVPQKWFVRAAAAVAAGFTALCFLASTMVLSWTLLAFEALFTASIGYLCIRFAINIPLMVQRGQFKIEQTVSVIGFFFFMYATINDALYHLDIPYYLGFTKSFALTGLSMLVFSFLQMTALFYGTMEEVKKARRAETESRMETETLQRLNQAKEEFLHNLSHELQTPLTVVSGFAQLTAHMMDDSVVDRAAVLDNMRRVDSEAARMERLVTLLLNAAAIEHGSFTLHKEPMDMAELLKTVSQVHFPVLDVGRNTIEVEVPSGLPLVWGDKERLLQVLLNLVSNAVKHTDGGSITLSAARKEGAVMVTVSDTGEGIPPELLPNLFKRYPKNRAAEGNGLGLFITAQIVAAHGGEIKIESISGSGTSVRFTIPINTSNKKI